MNAERVFHRHHHHHHHHYNFCSPVSSEPTVIQVTDKNWQAARTGKSHILQLIYIYIFASIVHWVT